MLTDPNAIDSPQEIALNCHDRGRSRFDHLVRRPLRIGSFDGKLVHLSGQCGYGSLKHHEAAATGSASSPKGHSIIAFPDAIQVSAQPGQAAGTYTGTVVISGSTFPLDNKTVQVTLIVSTSPVIDTTVVSTVQIQGFQGGGRFSSYPSFNVIIPTPGIFNNGSSPIASARHHRSHRLRGVSQRGRIQLKYDFDYGRCGQSQPGNLSWNRHDRIQCGEQCCRVDTRYLHCVSGGTEPHLFRRHRKSHHIRQRALRAGEIVALFGLQWPLPEPAP